MSLMALIVIADCLWVLLCPRDKYLTTTNSTEKLTPVGHLMSRSTKMLYYLTAYKLLFGVELNLAD